MVVYALVQGFDIATEFRSLPVEFATEFGSLPVEFATELSSLLVEFRVDLVKKTSHLFEQFCVQLKDELFGGERVELALEVRDATFVIVEDIYVFHLTTSLRLFMNHSLT